VGKDMQDNRASLPQDETELKSRVKRRLLSSNSVTGLSSKTINRMLSSLRKYLRYLILHDIDCPLPPDRIEFVKREKKVMQLASFDEFLKLIEFPTEFEKLPIVQKRNRAFLELLFSTGMRISEACNINLDQIGYLDKISGHFIINDKFFVTGKGRKQRFVYLTARSQHYLSEYINLRGQDKLPALFIPTKGSRKHLEDPLMIRVSTNYFQEKIVSYRKLLGINVQTSAHSLRHGFATFMAEKGASVMALQKLLGHESLNTTNVYLHTSEKLAEEAHHEFHPLNNI
jgi:site-specific recombinase XerD